MATETQAMAAPAADPRDEARHETHDHSEHQATAHPAKQMGRQVAIRGAVPQVSGEVPHELGLEERPCDAEGGSHKTKHRPHL